MLPHSSTRPIEELFGTSCYWAELSPAWRERCLCALMEEKRRKSTAKNALHDRHRTAIIKWSANNLRKNNSFVPPSHSHTHRHSRNVAPNKRFIKQCVDLSASGRWLIGNIIMDVFTPIMRSNICAKTWLLIRTHANTMSTILKQSPRDVISVVTRPPDFLWQKVIFLP